MAWKQVTCDACQAEREEMFCDGCGKDIPYGNEHLKVGISLDSSNTPKMKWTPTLHYHNHACLLLWVSREAEQVQDGS